MPAAGPALRRAEYVKIGFFTLLCASVAPIAGPRFGLALSNMGIVMGTGATVLLQPYSCAAAAAASRVKTHLARGPRCQQMRPAHALRRSPPPPP